ncbi:uncharacterized protein LOC123296107 [Chrysoperla carnea]|uniref:uncharacterized protein LOC123296107 n=1 Tax=Chrysoperla carnea TaxID=189513 RepID=UPI001D094357|nr:uncharacterized protein LOC123296107 [Chrysoperla carnea]
MKIPFHTILGPTLRKHFKAHDAFCRIPIFKPAGAWYVIVVALAGIFFSIFDIIRVIRDGPTLPPSSLRPRLKSGAVVSPATERDLKLMGSTLTLEYHTLLLLGVLTGHPVFLMPWLFMQGLIILLECVIFFLRLACSGICMDRRTLVAVILTPIHWVIVSCYFKSKISRCDL